MTGFLPRGLLFLFLITLLHAQQLPSIPQTPQELRRIQSELISHLNSCMQATISIQLPNGGYGSGVIVSPKGLVLSAAHVSGGVGRHYTAIFNNGKRVAITSLGLHSETDAALFQLKSSDKDYPFVPIGKNYQARLGDWVFALGHAGGFDKERGPVLRLGKIVRLAQATFQTDCKLIGGDSGGPLFSIYGELIGIHSRISGSLEENMHVSIHAFLNDWEALLEKQFLGNGPFAKRPNKAPSPAKEKEKPAP